MIKYPSIHVFYLLLAIASGPLYAQSGLLQLNLLLERGQKLAWSREFPVLIAHQIPAKIILGNIKGENTLIGMIEARGIDHQMILHGIQNDTHYVLNEWVDNSIQSGSLRLENKQDSLSGFWYNQQKTIRLTIQSVPSEKTNPQEIRQYQHGSQLIFTRYQHLSETLLNDSIISPEKWEKMYLPHKHCYDIQISDETEEYCRTGEIGLYSYINLDLVHIIHGRIPQIPHDEKFNSYISSQLNRWSEKVFQDSITDVAEQRWSRNQMIWFIPDYITDDLISGLLSIQFSGNRILHSVSIVYDRRKKQFYRPDDFFRSHSRWNEDFQQTAREFVFKKYQSVTEVFPAVLDNIRYHLTLNPQGMLISTDYTPYFGRLKILVPQQEYVEDLQRFIPFRNLLIE